MNVARRPTVEETRADMQSRVVQHLNSLDINGVRPEQIEGKVDNVTPSRVFVVGSGATILIDLFIKGCT